MTQVKTQLNKILTKVDFPINKRNLIKYAEYTGVDEKILRSLKKLPFGQYETLDKVLQAILSLKKTTVVKVNRVQLDKILTEIEYPTSKRKLLKTAENKGVDERILRRFKQLLPQQYENPETIRQAIDELENNLVFSNS